LGPGSEFHVIFLLIPLVILALFFFAQRFFVRRALALIRRIQDRNLRRASHAVLYAFVAFLVVVIADRMFIHALPRGGAISFLIAMAQLWLFGSFFGFLGIKVIQLLERLWDWVARFSRPQAASQLASPARRGFLQAASFAAGAIPLVAAAYGFGKERLDFRLHRVDIPIANLPAGLDGLKIAQLSDIHAGDFMPADQVRRAVDLANRLGADLAVITGDFITSNGDPLQQCIAELSRLRAPLGVWGCNGNHEIYADAEDQAEELFNHYGMRLLRQNNAELNWKGEAFNLMGVDYQRQHAPLGLEVPMLQTIEPLVRHDVPNILLSHNPNSFYRAAELGIELSLAGHTHGGQVKVEIIDHSWSPARFITPFVAGLYELPLHSPDATSNGAAKSALYVNRGLGTIGIPARLGVDPEISLLTLRRQS
jgi:predicted MPP superfamily phosphohydrolase